jgi:hypothetical protein
MTNFNSSAVQSLQEEKQQLLDAAKRVDNALTILTGGKASSSNSTPAASPALTVAHRSTRRARPAMSEATKAKIRRAAKARWKVRKSGTAAASTKKPRRRMSKAAKQKIRKAKLAYWAGIRKTNKAENKGQSKADNKGQSKAA